ncbi:uncharacterized protein LOC131162498 isoform X1 [Malania oleifera]|uniref:uncharacterized protein LOC131162498 isoform X1 n=1 Tax=Malania oleifera TaxID=397392 RepID=UPI0025ADC255|nr:uncharacterized protein LOC131162498 isoform X1 [Malania oleifera]
MAEIIDKDGSMVLTPQQNSSPTEIGNQPKSPKLEQSGTTTPNATETIPLFYTVPKEYFLKMMETDKWKSVQCPTGSSAQNVCELPLAERIEGWILEQRQRKDGRWDKFYYHEKSNKMFRSFISMIIFAKHGVLPKRWQKEKKENSNDYSTPLRLISMVETPSKRKKTAYHPNHYGALKEDTYFSYTHDEEIAMEFLREARKNLLNSNKETKASHGNKRDFEEGSPSQEEESTASLAEQATNSVTAVPNDDLLVENPVSYNFDI